MEHFLCRTLDKTISNLEVELAAARAAQGSILASAPPTETLKPTGTTGPRKYLMVVGINTAFSSRRRRDSVRATWMPQGYWLHLFLLLCCTTNLFDLINKLNYCVKNNRRKEKEDGRRERHYYSLCHWSQVCIYFDKALLRNQI